MRVSWTPREDDGLRVSQPDRPTEGSLAEFGEVLPCSKSYYFTTYSDTPDFLK